jgi:hypothetical protein
MSGRRPGRKELFRGLSLWLAAGLLLASCHSDRPAEPRLDVRVLGRAPAEDSGWLVAAEGDLLRVAVAAPSVGERAPRGTVELEDPYGAVVSEARLAAGAATVLAVPRGLAFPYLCLVLRTRSGERIPAGGWPGLPGARIHTRPALRPLWEQGFTDWEGPPGGVQGRWLGRQGVLLAPPLPQRRYLRLVGDPGPPCRSDPPRLRVAEQDGSLIGEAVLRGPSDLHFLLEPAGQERRVSLAVEPVFVPRSCGLGEDDRELGARFSLIELAEVVLSAGAYPLERDGARSWRWTAASFEIALPADTPAVALGLLGRAPRDCAVALALPNGNTARWELSEGRFLRTLPLPRGTETTELVIRGRVDPPFHPPGGTDTRVLGLQIEALAAWEQLPPPELRTWSER